MKIILKEYELKSYIKSMLNEIYDASTDENNKEQYVIFDKNSHKMLHWGSKDACRNMYDHTESFKNNDDIRVMRACDARKIVNSKEDVNESRIRNLVREVVEETFCEYEDAEDRFASMQNDAKDDEYYTDESWYLRVGENKYDTQKIGGYYSKDEAKKDAYYIRKKYPNLYVTIGVEKLDKIITESSKGKFHSQKLYNLFNKYGEPMNISMNLLTAATDDEVLILSPEQYQDMIKIYPQNVERSARQYLLSHGYNVKSTDYTWNGYFIKGKDIVDFILIIPRKRADDGWDIKDKRRSARWKDGAENYYGTFNSLQFRYAKTNPEFRQELMARYNK